MRTRTYEAVLYLEEITVTGRSVPEHHDIAAPAAGFRSLLIRPALTPATGSTTEVYMIESQIRYARRLPEHGFAAGTQRAAEPVAAGA